MFNSKEEAKKWMCKILEEHPYSFNKIFPNQKEGSGHFFKITFTNDSFIIDSEYGRGEAKANKFSHTIAYNGLKRIEVRRWKGLESVKSVKIKFYFENLIDNNESSAKWYYFLLPNNNKTEELEIILHEDLLNDKDFSQDNLEKVFEMLKC